MEVTVKRENFFRTLFRGSIPVLLAGVVFFGAILFKDRLEAMNGKKIFSENIPPSKPMLVPTIAVEPEPEMENFGVELEASSEVGDEYFADAAFVGDSLTEGWKIYNVGQHFEVMSMKGLNPRTAQSQPVYLTADGRNLIVSEAVSYLGTRKVYIMLGHNGLNYSEPEVLIEGYAGLVDQIKFTNPDTNIILQSVPPVTADLAARNSSYVKERVAYYNDLIKQLAIEKGIYFLDTYSALAGEDGYLVREYNAGDGMHLSPSGYSAWFSYLKTHTVRGNTLFILDKEGRIVPVRAE